MKNFFIFLLALRLGKIAWIKQNEINKYMEIDTENMYVHLRTRCEKLIIFWLFSCY